MYNYFLGYFVDIYVVGHSLIDSCTTMTVLRNISELKCQIVSSTKILIEKMFVA